MFVTLEGGEGVGKTTLMGGLARRADAAGITLCSTREPGGSEGALAIRALLTQGATDRWSPLSETLLLLAAREDHVRRTIAPALARGDLVVCDRFSDSTRAYQVHARGLPAATLATLETVLAAPRPDLTLLLDLDPLVGVERSVGGAKGEDRYERMGLGFHERVRAAFLSFAAAEPDRFIVLDARAAPEALADQAWAVIVQRWQDLARG